MNISGKPMCLIISNNGKLSYINAVLQQQYSIIEKKNVSEAHSVLRSKPIICIIICLSGKNKIPFKPILKFKNHFANIPIIAILSDYDLEMVRYCGELGILKVLCSSQVDFLPKVIHEIAAKKNTYVTLKDFGLNVEDFSGLVKEALKIIEKHYITLMSVQEIGDHLDVSESVFPKEFNKYNLIGPKRWLLYFKVRHALNLMKNKGLQLNEITYLSGFTNERRFNECFHRVFGKAPSICRDELINKDVKEFWCKNFEKIKEVLN